MKKFLLLPIAAMILTACSSNDPAPVVNANSGSSGVSIAQPVPVSEGTSAGWQVENASTNTGYSQPTPVSTAPTYRQPSVSAQQPLYNQEVEADAVKMETRTVTEKVKVKKKVPKKTATEKNVNIPRDANNKPMYNQIDKGFYDADLYTVRKGDTMYLIGYISGKDVNEIARLNNMKEPYQLSVGQKIKLSDGSSKTEYVEVEETVTKEVQVPVKPQVTYTQGANGTTYSSQGEITGPVKAATGSAAQAAVPVSGGVVATAGTASSAAASGGIRATTASAASGVRATETVQAPAVSNVKWQWPTAGRVVSNFSSAEGGNKGIDIAGSKGQDVRAAAAGRVVYAGNALRGYGNLIIIKHTDDFLSAYAHNDSIKVDEQDEVKAGEKIATMGNSGTDSTKLHFEIRYKGKSVDPTRYLPRR